MEQYFASTEEQKTVGCFLGFQEIGKLLGKVKYAVRERYIT